MDQEHCTALLRYLETVPDPRKKKGRRYSWMYLLTVLCMGLLSGQKTPYAIYRWAKWHEKELVELLAPFHGCAPGKMTLYRALKQMDVDALEKSIAQYGEEVDRWLRSQDVTRAWTDQEWHAVSADGKEVRGAGRHGPKVFLVSLACHGSGVTIGQTRTTGKPYEPHALAELLKGQDLKGMVITGDALYIQKRLAQQILDQGGDYFFIVKGNQPRLEEEIAFCFDQDPLPDEDRWQVVQYDKGHGRVETRRVTSTEALNHYLWMPGVGQVVRRECTRIMTATNETQNTVTYAITSLAHNRASVEQLAALWRGQWTIENRSHYVRDETMGEDRGQIAQGNAPQTMASLRNAVIAAIRAWGWHSVAEAIRCCAARLRRSYELLTKPPFDSALQPLSTFP